MCKHVCPSPLVRQACHRPSCFQKSNWSTCQSDVDELPAAAALSNALLLRLLAAAVGLSVPHCGCLRLQQHFGAVFPLPPPAGPHAVANVERCTTVCCRGLPSSYRLYCSGQAWQPQLPSWTVLPQCLQ